MSTIKDKTDRNDYDKSITNMSASRDGNRNRNKNDIDDKNLSKELEVNKSTSFFSRFKRKKSENLQEKNTNTAENNARSKKLLTRDDVNISSNIDDDRDMDQDSDGDGDGDGDRSPSSDNKKDGKRITRSRSNTADLLRKNIDFRKDGGESPERGLRKNRSISREDRNRRKRVRRGGRKSHSEDGKDDDDDNDDDDEEEEEEEDTPVVVEMCSGWAMIPIAGESYTKLKRDEPLT